MNKVVLIGKIEKKPEFGHSADGPIANLRVATHESYTDRNGNKVDRTEWHLVITQLRGGWETETICRDYLKKDSFVFVEGRLQTHKWQNKHGQNERVTVVKASRVQFLNGWELESVPSEFKTPEFCLIAIQQNGLELRHVPSELITQKMCLAAVQRNGLALEYVPEKYITPEICLVSVLNGGELEIVPEEFKTPEMCLAALTRDCNWTCQFVPESFLQNLEFCRSVVQLDSWSSTDVYVQWTPTLYIAAILQHSFSLEYIPDEAKRRPECYISAVQQDGFPLRYVPNEFRTQELCLDAVKTNPQAFRYVPEKFQEGVYNAIMQQSQDDNYDFARLKQEWGDALIREETRGLDNIHDSFYAMSGYPWD